MNSTVFNYCWLFKPAHVMLKARALEFNWVLSSLQGFFLEVKT